MPKYLKIGALTLLLATANCRHQTTGTLSTSMGDIPVELNGWSPEHLQYFLQQFQQSDTLFVSSVWRDNEIGVKFAAEKATNPPPVKNSGPILTGTLVLSGPEIAGTPGDFFLIQGRPHSAESLKKIADAKKIILTPEEKNAYLQFGGMPQWHGKCTVIGKCTGGQDVVDRIAALPYQPDTRPLLPVYILWTTH
jgi:hypothetical protein